ncbi:MAG TPA: hypothetical protein VLX92_04840 [Kofleriaceae bacterium]|nr:hypothetical protein [Kofleriaceae bacterium]
MIRALAIAAACCAARPAAADTGFEPWSWLAQVSGLAAYGQNAEARPVFGAELRVRRSADGPAPGSAWSLGLGVETASFDTVEPALTVGFEPLHRLCDDCDDVPMFGSLRAALGGGVAWRSGERTEPFGVARLSAGIVLARRDDPDSRHHLSAQADVVIEGQLAADGSWRIGFGIELDPLRIIQDAVAFNR